MSEWATDIRPSYTTKTAKVVNAPHSRDLLATLISLLADQENVNITYELEENRTIS